jgi:hypothetical protein
LLLSSSSCCLLLTVSCTSLFSYLFYCYLLLTTVFSVFHFSETRTESWMSCDESYFFLHQVQYRPCF